jgi:hypothetical protein
MHPKLSRTVQFCFYSLLIFIVFAAASVKTASKTVPLGLGALLCVLFIFAGLNTIAKNKDVIASGWAGKWLNRSESAIGGLIIVAVLAAILWLAVYGIK